MATVMTTDTSGCISLPVARVMSARLVLFDVLVSPVPSITLQAPINPVTPDGYNTVGKMLCE